MTTEAIEKLIPDAESGQMETTEVTYERAELVQKLEQISKYQDVVGEIKEQISLIIDSITQRQSILTRTANFWRDLALWQKIGLGILIIAPPVALAIVFQTIMFGIAAIFALVTYVAASYFFDEHNEQEKKSTGELKENLNRLADGLGVVMTQLDLIKDELAKEIDAMRLENERLLANTETLTAEVSALASHGKELEKIHESLQNDYAQLEQNNKVLDSNLALKTFRLDSVMKELDQAQADFKKNQEELTQKTTELKSAEETLKVQIQEMTDHTKALESVITTMSSTHIKDKEEQTAFRNRLDAFLKMQHIECGKVATALTETERKLSEAQRELFFNNKRNEQLLEREKLALEQIEKTVQNLQAPSAEIASRRKLSDAGTLKRMGLLNSHTPKITTVVIDNHMSAHGA